MTTLPRIGVGTFSNDGTGDSPKTVGTKINTAFELLETQYNEQATLQQSIESSVNVAASWAQDAHNTANGIAASVAADAQTVTDGIAVAEQAAADASDSAASAAQSLIDTTTQADRAQTIADEFNARITVSTVGPSGGIDGDIWFKV